MSKATNTQWRVQVRKSRTATWKNKGLFETRAVARHEAQSLRMLHGFTLGNTRVVRYVKGETK